MAITKWDEYLIHQTYDTIDAGEVEVDRLYLSCHNTDGTLHLAMGLGSYPQANIMDGYICVRHENRQHNLRLSRHLQGDRADTQIGPLSVKVIEPLKQWGLYLDDNDYGIRCSLEFKARSPIYTHKPSMIPFVHYNQMGRYAGSITLGSRQFNADGFIGARDRSWRAWFSKNPAVKSGHCLILAHFTDFCLSLAGVPLWEGPEPSWGAAILHDDGSIIPITEMYHRIEFHPKVRSLTKLNLLLKDADGKERYVTAQPISPAIYFTGACYDREGEDKGAFSMEGEQWDVSQPIDVDSPRIGQNGMSV